jgi:hypothetical protein
LEDIVKRVAIALAASVLGAASAQATVLFSWEGTTADGWTLNDNSGGGTGGALAAPVSGVPGVTDGSKCIQVTFPPLVAGNWSSISSNWSGDKWATIAANQIISVDITPVSSFTGNVGVGYYLNAEKGGTGWTTPEVMLNPTGTTTVSVNYSTYPLINMAELGTSTWGAIQIYFDTSGGYTAQQFYFDNVRVTGVPEPASLGLLGLGSLALLRRRRA